MLRYRFQPAQGRPDCPEIAAHRPQSRERAEDHRKPRPEGAERERLHVAVPALLPAAFRLAHRDRRKLRRAFDDVAMTRAGEGTGRTRVLGIDVGSGRIGLAVLDETRTLAFLSDTVP